MALTEFLESLFDNGRVSVSAPDEIVPDNFKSAHDVLVNSEQIWRTDHSAPPPFDVQAAVWAAEILFRAAQFQVFRDVDAEFIHAAFATPEPDGSASSHYSVDLCFRYLGDVLHQAKRASAGDPLNDEIVRLLQRWPLSAVGMKGFDPPVRGDAFKHDGLWRMFIDRIVACSDQQLMTDPSVQKSIAAAIGPFPELVPAYRQLTNDQQTTHERETPTE